MNDLLWSRLRLTIVAQLLEMEWMSFNELLKATGATFGNLGSHVGKLVAAGYVEEEKRIVDRKVQTRYRLTSPGRAAFVKHITELEDLITAVRREHSELGEIGVEKPPEAQSQRR